MRNLASRTFIVALCVLILAAPSFGASPKGRAVSLNALATSMKMGVSKQSESLFGITQVLGYVIDPRSEDVIIMGKVDPGLPALHLDDFVVALRNAWLMYTQVQGRTRYYSYPGCSIDPDPSVLRELSQIEKAHLNFSDADAMQAYKDQWKEIGSRPQKVRVMGVPWDSRFSKVMVDADFYMKRLVNGSVELKVEGFESLMGIRQRAYRQEVASGTTPALSLNRFWFNPGETTYEEKKGMVLLRDCSVCLLTEEEFLSHQGAVKGMGRPDPLAAEFAKSFSAHYADIAAVRPIYHELEGLFRFAAIAQLLKDDRADQFAKSGFGYLLHAHKLKVVPVSRAVKGLADALLTEETIQTAEGPVTFKALQSFSGGVSMAVKPKRVTTSPAPKAALPAAVPVRPAGPAPKSVAAKSPRVGKAPSKNPVVSARKSTKQVSWDFSLQDLE